MRQIRVTVVTSLRIVCEFRYVPGTYFGSYALRAVTTSHHPLSAFIEEEMKRAMFVSAIH